MTDIARLTPEQLDQMGKVSLDIAESLKLPTIIKQWENYFEKMNKKGDSLAPSSIEVSISVKSTIKQQRDKQY